jgi:5'-nucleotidase
VAAQAAVDPAAEVVINEVYGGGGNSGAMYKQDFVELYNKSSVDVSLAGWSLQYASATGTFNATNVMPFGGVSVAAGDHLLVGLAYGAGGTDELPTPDVQGSPALALSGTGGKIALVSSVTALGSCGTSTASCSLKADVIDYVGWGSATTDFAGFGPAPSTTNPSSVSRKVGFQNTADNAADFDSATTPSPTAASGGTVTPPTADPSGPAEPGEDSISDIQGPGVTSALVGATVTTRGVVTASYPTGGLNGFVIQEPGSGGTIDDVTTLAGRASRAVFIYLGPALAASSPAAGAYVEVTGLVSEYNGLTQVGVAATADVKILADAAPVAPAAVVSDWPETDEQREALESMLWQPRGSFTVTNTYETNYYGVVGLAYGDGPLTQPSEVAPGTDAAAIATVKAQNAARAVVLDDGSSMNFSGAANAPSNTPAYISSVAPVRVGATASFTDPVIVDYRNGTWTLNPTARVLGPANSNSPATFADTRTPEPDAAALGSPAVKLAAFNVLNYFPTTALEWIAMGNGNSCTSYNRPGVVPAQPITVDSCGDDGPRGAWDEASLRRQQDKIVAAINALDADVVGLTEIENSAKLGQAADSGLATLVAALNADAGAGTWAYVPSPATLPDVSQQDVISAAIIYRPAAVTPVGAAVALGDQSGPGQPFANAREPIGQAFAVNAGGDPFLYVVNHLKSKGSGTAPDLDAPEEGNANADRLAQADALAAWVAEDVLPGYTDPVLTDVFLVGDFNSYTQEKPLRALSAAGFDDVELTLKGDAREYSYSYSGLSGSLDHILANQSAMERLTGVDVWNVNSGESIALEYSRYRYSATDFYAADFYRSSDHDPVIVGLAGSALDSATVQLLNVNDFHGRINDDTVRFAATVDNLRTALGADNTLFLSAGDNVGASLFASAIQNDIPTLKVLNALDLKASAVGNHEFDKGWDFLRDTTMAQSQFVYLGANVERDGSPVLGQCEVFTVDGVRVGVIGVVTQETPTLVSPAGVAGLTFTDEVAAMNRVAAYLRGHGLADVIVAEYHDGSPAGVVENATLAEALAGSAVLTAIVEGTSADVDVIFTGHTHKLYAWDGPTPGATDGATRPVLQTSSYGSHIGQVVLTIDRATMAVTAYEARNVPVADTAGTADELAAASPVVAEVKTIVDEALAHAAVVGREAVGRVSADITTAFAGGSHVDGSYVGGTRDDRAEASTLGTLVGNALRDQLKVLPAGADFGVVNPGGLRAELLYDDGVDHDGTITFAEAKSVLPFDNTLATVELTGAQVVRLLEQQWQRDADGNLPSRPYLQLGLSDDVVYTYTVTAETCVAAAAGQAQVACERGHVTSVMVKGLPLDLTKTYKIATFSFLAAGGDNFWVFQEASKVTDTGLLDWEGFVDYLRAVTADQGAVSPDYARAGVRVEGLPATVTQGETLDFVLSQSQVHSLGAPVDRSVEVFLDGVSLGSFPVTDGTADIAVTVPADAVGEGRLSFLVSPGGAWAAIPLTIEAGSPATLTPTWAGDGRLPGTGASDATVTLAAALAACLIGSALMVRRRRICR